jgi:hypothetical protein
MAASAGKPERARGLNPWRARSSREQKPKQEPDGARTKTSRTMSQPGITTMQVQTGGEREKGDPPAAGRKTQN